MELIIQYKGKSIADFATLVGQEFNLRSPCRSTVPLLAFWSDPIVRLAAFTTALGLVSPTGAVSAHFEFTVKSVQGDGNPSHTDLMIIYDDVAIAKEAKYTEGEYDTVAKWLAKDPSENKRNWLAGWLEMINRATDSHLTTPKVESIAYQLIHRAASVCSVANARNRAVVYQVFDPHDLHLAYYRGQLQLLSSLIKEPTKLPLFFCQTRLRKAPAYGELQQDWLSRPKPKPDYGTRVRELLRRREVADFDEMIVEKF